MHLKMTDEETELHRHKCEVRYLKDLLNARGRKAVQDYLDSKPVAKRREKLRVDLNKLLAEHRALRAALGEAARKVQKW